MRFVDKPFELKLTGVPKRVWHSGNISIESKNSSINVNYPVKKGIDYLIECPDILFKSLTDKTRLCKTDQYGKFSLNADDLNIIEYATYSFLYTMKSTILNYSEDKAFSFHFYNKKSGSCPDARLFPSH